MKKCLPIFVVLLMAAVANAAITTDFQNGGVVNLPTAGTPVVVNDMLVNVTGAENDWTNAQITIVLSEGLCYNTGPSGGGDTEPDPFVIGFLPDLAYDTYLADPDGWDQLVSFASTPAGTKNVPSTLVDASWFDDPNTPNGPGTFKIAQLTFDPDAQGTVTGFVFDTETSGVGVELVGWSVVDGAIVPEPVTLALLASGGICVLLRKKR